MLIQRPNKKILTLPMGNQNSVFQRDVIANGLTDDLVMNIHGIVLQIRLGLCAVKVKLYVILKHNNLIILRNYRKICRIVRNLHFQIDLQSKLLV
jgi:hypothetical protein